MQSSFVVYTLRRGLKYWSERAWAESPADARIIGSKADAEALANAMGAECVRCSLAVGVSEPEAMTLQDGIEDAKAGR